MGTPPKRCELDIVLYYLNLNFTKKQIREKLKIKPTALANRLRRLEDLGCIERKGKHIINVLRSSHENPQVTRNKVHMKLNKRGHAHNFTIYFPKENNLKNKPKVINELKQKTLERLKFGSYKLIKKKYTIWINKENLTIYSNNSYYSANALNSKFQALKDVDNLVQELKDRFGFSGIYGIEIFREHYGLIFNKFAKWIINKKRKLYVKDKGNKTILWVDKSRKDDIGLEEFEGEDPFKINSADKFFDSHDQAGWKYDAEHHKSQEKKVASLEGVFPAMEEYNKNLKLHIKVQEEQLKTQKANQKVLDQMQKYLNKLSN